MIFFWLFIAFIILQRLSELFIAGRNEKILLSKGAVEYDKEGYKFIVMMHISFFITLAAEKIWLHRELNSLWLYFIIIFLSAQFLRYWAIISLGEYWNTKIIILPGNNLVKKGPYRFFNHPNYIAVIAELAVIPLIFSCYITSIVFTAANLIVLVRRIRIEENVLQKLS